MEYTTKKLQQLLEIGKTYIDQSSEIEFSRKNSPEKWSKKEIFGHLIDSAVNNLQRFTEIQFRDKPYPIKKYDQDQLVIANNYQNASTEEIRDFWSAINKRILSILKLQTKETLNYQILLGEKLTSDLNFLIEDYVHHLEHHLKQIVKK